jgi:iron complex outermembrane recepter protein
MVGKLCLLGHASTVAAACVIAATPASAADTSGTSISADPDPSLETIVVTARRREESAQDVPLVVTSISGTQLQKQGVVTTADLQFTTPGLVINPSARSQSTPVFTVRGMRQTDISITTDPAVGLYFAEVPIARPNGFNGALFDLASVQTLKGPQGTLFGRNTVGGAVLFTPNAPGKDFEGRLQLQAGSYGLRDAEGVVNLPIANGLALRLSGKFTRRDGYMINKSPADFDRRSNDINGESVRAFLRLEPVAGVTSDTIGTWYNSEDHGTAYKLIEANSAFFPISSLRPTFETSVAQALALGKYEFIGTPFINADGSLQPLFSRTNVKSIQNTTIVYLNDNTFIKNIVGYRDTTQYALFDLSPIALTTVKTNAFFRSYQISEELQVQGKLKDLNWVVGGFYFKEKGDDGAPSNQFSTRITYSSNARALNSNRSVFAHFDYTPTFLQGLTVSGGIRYNDDKRTTWAKPRRPITVNGVNGYACGLDGVNIVPSSLGEECAEFRGDVGFSKVTYDVAISYKMTPDVMVYGTNRRGYRSGAVFGRPATLAAFLTPTNPEAVDDFEVGLKSQFELSGVRGRFNFAYFHTNYRNAQRIVTSVDSNGVLGSVYLNAAAAKIDGIDVDASLALTPRLTVNAAYSYINPRYTSFTDKTAAGVTVDVSDSDFTYTPKNVITLGAHYEVPISTNFGNLSFQANYYKQSSFDTVDINTANCGPGGAYRACALNAGSRLPGYNLLNLRADWERFMNSRIDLAVFVNNVTNEYYFTAGNAQLSNFGTNSVVVGAPRMYGMQIRVNF